MSWLDPVQNEMSSQGWDADLSGPVHIKCATKWNRFWLPYSSQASIVFLTAKPTVVVWEHSVKIGKDFRNYATCLRHLKMTCPLCELSDQRVKVYRAGLFTVIDRRSYELKHGERAGQTVSNQKRLFVAKKDTWEILARRAKAREEAGQSLRGAEYNVSRGSDKKCPGVGNDFEFKAMVDLAEFPDNAELNYEELMKPDTALVREYLKALQAEGPIGDAAVDDLAGHDNIPF